MKYSDVKPMITRKSEESDEPVLVFTHIIDELDGSLIETDTTPDSYDNVRCLTGHIFYAWDNECPDDGAVFFGGPEENQL